MTQSVNLYWYHSDPPRNETLCVHLLPDGQQRLDFPFSVGARDKNLYKLRGEQHIQTSALPCSCLATFLPLLEASS